MKTRQLSKLITFTSFFQEAEEEALRRQAKPNWAATASAGLNSQKTLAEIQAEEDRDHDTNSFFFPGLYPGSGHGPDPKEETSEDGAAGGATSGPLTIPRPVPLFSSHHLPAFIREKLRAAAGVASSCAAPGYPGPLPRAPLSPDTLDKMKEAAETSAENNNVENNNVPS